MVRRRVPPPGSPKVPHTPLTTPPKRGGVRCSTEARPSEESMGAKVLAGFRALQRRAGCSTRAEG